MLAAPRQYCTNSKHCEAALDCIQSVSESPAPVRRGVAHVPTHLDAGVLPWYGLHLQYALMCLDRGLYRLLRPRLFRRSTFPLHVARDVVQFTRFTFALLVHTFYFCPAGTIQLSMVRHPRSLVVGGGWDEIFFFGMMWYTTYVKPATTPPSNRCSIGRCVGGPVSDGGWRLRQLDTIEGGFTMFGICAVLPRCG